MRFAYAPLHSKSSSCLDRRTQKARPTSVESIPHLAKPVSGGSNDAIIRVKTDVDLLLNGDKTGIEYRRITDELVVFVSLQVARERSRSIRITTLRSLASSKHVRTHDNEESIIKDIRDITT